MYTSKFAGLACFLAMLTVLLLCGAALPEKSENVTVIEDNIPSQVSAIRVALPIQYGLGRISEGGVISGYTYDYIKEIAQYTNCEYKFIAVEKNGAQGVNQALSMLDKGTVDVVGAITYSDEMADKYSYSSYSYGSTYNVIAVKKKNTVITDANLSSFKKIRIGIDKNLPPQMREQLESYAKMNNINIELMYRSTYESVLSALREGDVQGILTTDTMLEDDMRIVAKFSPTPFYFVAAKENDSIITDINRALSVVESINSQLQSTLYGKHYGTIGSELLFTDDENEFIKQGKVLRVGVRDNNAPMEFYDQEGKEFAGVSVGVLKEIANMSGLKFEFVPIKDEQAAIDMLRQGRLDIIAGVSRNSHIKGGKIANTISYLNAPVMIVMRESDDPNSAQHKVKAQTNNYVYNDCASEIKIYDTAGECLSAIADHSADYCYINNFDYQFLSASDRYSGFANYAQTDDAVQEFCLGVVKPADIRLVSVLNKSIRSISNETMQNILYINAYNPQKLTLIQFAKSNPLAFILICILSVVFLMSVVFVFFAEREKVARKMSIENTRYHELAEMTGEHIYEYSYEDDLLTFTKVNPLLFNGKQRVQGYKKSVERYVESGGDVHNTIYSSFEQKKDATVELNIVMSDKSLHWYRVITKIIRDADGDAVYAIGKLIDVQSERDERESLIKQARRDSMTGLFNSSATAEEIDAIIASEDIVFGLLIVMDVDHFKDINDCYGHFVGDKVLVSVAKTLKCLFGKHGIVGRVGGDEFVAFLPRVTSVQEAKKIGKTLCKKISEIQLNDKSNVITMSAGMVIVDSPTSYSKAFKKADKLLYIAKSNGRNQVAI